MIVFQDIERYNRLETYLYSNYRVMSEKGRDAEMEEMKQILSDYIGEIKKIYGSHLQKVILYGSYARGDATKTSDIDIMILVDLDDFEIKKYADELSDITYDMNLDYDIMIMPIVKNQKHFNYWVQAYPFYNNVNREGVALYGAA